MTGMRVNYYNDATYDAGNHARWCQASVIVDALAAETSNGTTILRGTDILSGRRVSIAAESVAAIVPTTYDAADIATDATRCDGLRVPAPRRWSVALAWHCLSCERDVRGWGEPNEYGSHDTRCPVCNDMDDNNEHAVPVPA